MVQVSVSLAILAVSILLAAEFPAFMVCSILFAIGLLLGSTIG